MLTTKRALIVFDKHTNLARMLTTNLVQMLTTNLELMLTTKRALITLKNIKS